MSASGNLLATGYDVCRMLTKYLGPGNKVNGVTWQQASAAIQRQFPNVDTGQIVLDAGANLC